MKINRNLITNKKAQTNVIILAIFTTIMGFALLTVGNYMYYAVASAADPSTQISVPGQYAAGTITFSGNVTNGDMVNITYGGLHVFEFNTTTASPSQCKVFPGCIIVNVYNTNTSIISATNLTNAINTNVSTNIYVTATNTVANVTSLRYTSRGTAGNSVGLVDTGVNIAVSGATLTGGVNDITGQNSQNTLNSYFSTALPLMGLAIMILSFAVIFITLKKSFGSQVGR